MTASLYMAVIVLMNGQTVTLDTDFCMVIRDQISAGRTIKVSLDTQWVSEIWPIATIVCIDRTPKKYKVAIR